MCKIGDILLIYNAKSKKKPVGMHPFVVLDDRDGIVSGIYAYDFIGLLMTSADTDDKKERLGNVEGNFPIAETDKIMNAGREKDNRYSFVESNNFFYFDKKKIKYVHIGRLDVEVYNLIVEFIEEISHDGVVINRILDRASVITEEEGD